MHSVDVGKVIKLYEVRYHDGTASIFVDVLKYNHQIAKIECLFYSIEEKGLDLRDACVKNIVKTFTNCKDLDHLNISKASNLLEDKEVYVVNKDGINTGFFIDNEHYFSNKDFFNKYHKINHKHEFNY